MKALTLNLSMMIHIINEEKKIEHERMLSKVRETNEEIDISEHEV